MTEMIKTKKYLDNGDYHTAIKNMVSIDANVSASYDPNGGTVDKETEKFNSYKNTVKTKAEKPVMRLTEELQYHENMTTQPCCDSLVRHCY